MQSGSRCIPAYWFLTTPGKYTLVQLNGVRYVDVFELRQTSVILLGSLHYLWLIAGWAVLQEAFSQEASLKHRQSGEG